MVAPAIIHQKPIAMKTKEVKYLYLELESRNGEYEYHHKSVHQLPVKTNEDEFGEDYARDFYGGGSDEQDGGFYFNGGEIHVSVNKVQLITKEQYDVLTKFI